MIPRLARSATWIAVLALAILSLLPRDQMLRTGASGWSEHAIAYAGTMTLAALGYGRRHALLRPCAALVAYAGALELAQALSPGRSPGLFDFLAGAAGAVIAAVIAARVQRGVVARRTRSNAT
jgi:VanZ family protein